MPLPEKGRPTLAPSLLVGIHSQSAVPNWPFADAIFFCLVQLATKKVSLPIALKYPPWLLSCLVAYLNLARLSLLFRPVVALMKWCCNWASHSSLIGARLCFRHPSLSSVVFSLKASRSVLKWSPNSDSPLCTLITRLITVLWSFGLDTLTLFAFL